MPTSSVCMYCEDGVITTKQTCGKCNGTGISCVSATQPAARIGKATFEWGEGPRDNVSWGLIAAEGDFNVFEDKEPVYIVPVADYEALLAERDALVQTLDMALESYAEDHNNVASERDSLKIMLADLEVPRLRAE